MCDSNGIGVMYEEGLVDLPKVSVKIEHATLEEALTQILTANQLSYKVLDEHSIRVERRVR
jgi:hypothetical protein